MEPKEAAMLSKEDYAVIQSLHQRGIYLNDIAEELEVHPRTVKRALQRGGAPKLERKSSPSKLDPYKAKVDELLGRIWNSMVIFRSSRR
jgi:IS30 family transposase